MTLAALLIALVAAAPLMLAQPNSSEPRSEQADCPSLEACIDELIAQGERSEQVSDDVEKRILSFGPPAIDALLPLLRHSNATVRDSAGMTIRGFRRIDPRYLPTLVDAWRHGDTPAGQGSAGWMPRAIAATGTEQAVRLLWSDFERDPSNSSNSQIFFALADLGSERIKPLILHRFDQCMRDNTGKSCEGLDELLSELKDREGKRPSWSVEPYVQLVRSAASDEVREGAEGILVSLRHPLGLTAYHKRLAALDAAMGADEDRAWFVQDFISGLASYGPDARASGPIVARFLADQVGEDLRAEAALALGQIGDTTSVQALLDLATVIPHDWLLAYNAAESLGRLRATEAVPLLTSLSKDHWHPGVRNNATRALNMIAGGKFARPGIFGDGQPRPAPRDENGEEYFYFGKLRFAGDDASNWCETPDLEAAFSRDPIDSVRWPVKEDRDLRFQPVKEATQAAIRERISPKQARGRVMAVTDAARGALLGFNAGEFGGGLIYLPETGAPETLFGEPVFAAWRMDNRIYVAAGLAHLVLDRGHLYVVNPSSAKLEHVIRLPASPTDISIAKARAVIVHTREGDVAIRPDGRLVDPSTLGSCTDD